MMSVIFYSEVYNIYRSNVYDNKAQRRGEENIGIKF